jgi:hypothetical protein
MTRLKEIYRQLVRRLHPDARTDAKDGVEAIWHEVQEAYVKGDVERLGAAFCVERGDRKRVGCGNFALSVGGGAQGVASLHSGDATQSERGKKGCRLEV